MKKKLLIASMAITTALCGALGFSACGGDDADKEITLTAETDFTALISEKVDEDGWKKAMTLKDYTVDFTAKIEADRHCLFKLKENEVYACRDFGEGITMEEHYKLQDGLAYGYQKDKENHVEELTLTPDDEGYDEILEEFLALSLMYRATYYPDFADKFSSFTYDETKHSYVCTGTVQGTELFNGDNIVPAPLDYVNVEVKIINGRLAYLTGTAVAKTASDTAQPVDLKLYDFGNTTITHQKVEENS